MRRTVRLLLLLAAALLLVPGCGGSGGSSHPVAETPPPPPPPPAAGPEISVLFMGNSHTLFNDVPGLVASLMTAARPGVRITAVTAPGSMFLEDRLDDAATRALLEGRTWHAVVFQAQKYSASGQFVYPTAQAEELIRIARRQGAVPVLFPEWAREGVGETSRIFAVHVGIATRSPACVAPIPQAWDQALAANPGLRLHATDGNHAVEAGSFLAALMLYATLTGQSPMALPAITPSGVDADLQARLRAAADETVRTMPPRQYCPGDALVGQ